MDGKATTKPPEEGNNDKKHPHSACNSTKSDPFGEYGMRFDG